MSVCSLRSIRTGVLAFASTALLMLPAAGCKDDEGPGKLFEENGVWSLVDYDLPGEGVLTAVNSMSRRDSFLLKFDSDLDVVTAAWCGHDESDDPNNSTCRQQYDSAEWYCRCFAYAYEEDQMRWVEFQAGDAPPMVDLDGEKPMAPTGETDGETDGETGGEAGADDGSVPPGGDGLISLSGIPTQSSTYDFQPLPAGVFGSNGESSRFRMQQKAPTIFDNDVTCTPCAGE